jgi:outer membrane protein OmpA-like peptidoglycan-associated protein
MKYSIVFILLLFYLTGFSQSFKEEYARKLSAKQEYTEAYPVWVELSNNFLRKNKGSIESLRKATEAAFKQELFLDAFYWDSIIVNSGFANATDWLNYFKLLTLNKRYELLQISIDSAIIHFPADGLIKEWKNSIPNILKALNDKSDIELTELRPNATSEEFGAIPYKKGILFVTNQFNTGYLNSKFGRTGQNFTNIAYIDNLKAIDDKTGITKKLKIHDLWEEIPNTKAHDGPISFSKDFRKAYITRNQITTDNTDNIKQSKLELKVYSKKGGEWLEENSFAWNSTNYSTGHAVIDNEKNLIFSSDRPGGYGKADIYKCVWQIDHWSEPINLGPKINTSQDELFPFVSSKGNLYFSSDGWPGIGGLDVFRSNKNSEVPEHMETPINSFADDFAFYINDESGKGFLSSNRTDWKDRLYKISKISMGAEVEIHLVSCKERPLLNFPILILDKNTNSQVTAISDDNGIIKLDLIIGHHYLFIVNNLNNTLSDSSAFFAKQSGYYQKTLQVKFKEQVISIQCLSDDGKSLEGVMLNLRQHSGAVKRGFTSSTGMFTFSYKQDIDTVRGQLINYNDEVIFIPKVPKNSCNDTVFIRMRLTHKSKKDFINLGMILYDLDKYELRPEGKVELDKLVRYMKERPELIVELSSHTDSRADADYNITLSQNRSQSCISYIISKGIPANHIIAQGYGEARLLNNCSDNVPCSKEEHQRNRRTELRLLNPE